MPRAAEEQQDPIAAAIKAAIELIGKHETKDHKFDCEHHIKQLSTVKALDPLRSVLTDRNSVAGNPIADAFAKYKTLSKEATRWKQWYELTVFLFTVPLIASLLALYYLALVPQENSEIPREFSVALRVCLSLVLGIGAAGLLGALERAFGWAKWLRKPLLDRIPAGNQGSEPSARVEAAAERRASVALWLEVITIVCAVALATWAAYLWIIPDHFSINFRWYLDWATIAVPPACLLLIEIFWGGIITRVLQRFVSRLLNLFRKRSDGDRPSASPWASLTSRWYSARGRAEEIRRHMFGEVLRGCARPEANGTKPTPAALLQGLEYFRRFQIEVQNDYYSERFRDAERSAHRLNLLRRMALAIFGLALLVRALLWWASRSEQGSTLAVGYAPLDDFASFLIFLSMRGADEATSIIALLMLAIYLSLQVRSWMLGEENTRRRVSNTLVALNDASSNEPGRANLELAPTPLSEARRAAAEGNGAAVEAFISSVNGVLAAEVSEWGRPFIMKIVDGKPRIESHERLTSEHFERIVDELGRRKIQVLRGVRRVGKISARKAEKAEEVKTRCDGPQSNVKARRGDWIATTLDDNLMPILDRQGEKNIYVIKAKLFDILYVQIPNGQPGFYAPRAVNIADAIEISGGIDIVAPWGDRQRMKECWLVRKSNGTLRHEEIYGVAMTHFEITYGRRGHEQV